MTLTLPASFWSRTRGSGVRRHRKRAERVLRPNQRACGGRIERVHPDAHATVGTPRRECHVTSVGGESRPAGEGGLRRRRDVEGHRDRRLCALRGTTLEREQPREEDRQRGGDPCCRSKQARRRKGRGFREPRESSNLNRARRALSRVGGLVQTSRQNYVSATCLRADAAVDTAGCVGQRSAVLSPSNSGRPVNNSQTDTERPVPPLVAGFPRPARGSVRRRAMSRRRAHGNGVRRPRTPRDCRERSSLIPPGQIAQLTAIGRRHDVCRLRCGARCLLGAASARWQSHRIVEGVPIGTRLQRVAIDQLMTSAPCSMPYCAHVGMVRRERSAYRCVADPLAIGGERTGQHCERGSPPSTVSRARIHRAHAADPEDGILRTDRDGRECPRLEKRSAAPSNASSSSISRRIGSSSRHSRASSAARASGGQSNAA